MEQDKFTFVLFNNKGRFGGEMWFEEGKEKGSVFYISIPVRKL